MKSLNSLQLYIEKQYSVRLFAHTAVHKVVILTVNNGAFLGRSFYN